MYYDFITPVVKKTGTKKSAEVIKDMPAQKREMSLKPFLSYDEKMVLKHAKLKKLDKYVVTKLEAPATKRGATPYPGTMYLGLYAQHYYDSKGHLPYIVANKPLDDYAGMDGKRPVHWVDWPNPVAAFFATAVSDGQGNYDIIFGNRAASNPENTYIKEDFSESPAVFAGQPFDEWTLYDNYQDNYSFFNTHRTCDTNWDAIHDLFSSFFISTFGEVNNWDRIENYYGWVAYQLWLLLTKNLTVTQHSLTISVGNAFKLFAALLSMTDADVGQAMFYYHSGTQTYQQVILNDEFGFKVKKFKLMCPSSITNRKPEYRKTRNMTYKIEMIYDEIREVPVGTPWGIKSRDGIEYWFALDDDGYALAYVPEELDWNGATSVSGYLQKEFEFSAPVHINFVGKVMNSASTTNTVYEGVNTLGLCTIKDLVDTEFWHSGNSFGGSGSESLINDAGPNSTTTTKTYTLAQAKPRYTPTGGVGYYRSDHSSVYAQYREYTFESRPSVVFPTFQLTGESCFSLGPVIYRGYHVKGSECRIKLTTIMHYSGVTYQGSASGVTCAGIRLRLVKCGQKGYTDWEIDFGNPTVQKATFMPYVEQPDDIYTLSWDLEDYSDAIAEAAASLSSGEALELQIVHYSDGSNYYSEGPMGGWHETSFSIGMWYAHFHTADYDVEGLAAIGHNFENSWSAEQLCYIGSLDKPVGKWALHPNAGSQSETFTNYEVVTRLRDIITMAVFKRVFAENFTPAQAAEILRYCQDPATGLEIDSEILRNLVVEATTVRATRTNSIFTGLKQYLSLTVDSAVDFVKSFSVPSGLSTWISGAATWGKGSSENARAKLGSKFNSYKNLLTTNNVFTELTENDWNNMTYDELVFAIGELDPIKDQLNASSRKIIDDSNAEWKILSKRWDRNVDAQEFPRPHHIWEDEEDTEARPANTRISIISTLTEDLQSYVTAANEIYTDIDADMSRDNPALENFIRYNQDQQKYEIKLKAWFNTIKASELGVDFSSLATLGYSTDAKLDSLIDDYLMYVDEIALAGDDASQSVKDKCDALQVFLKGVNASILEENCQLTAALMNYKLEECYDDIANDEALMTSDDALANVTAKIDEIKNTLIADVDAEADKIEAGSSALLKEAKFRSSLISDKFKNLAENSAQKARSYYTQLIAQFTEVKEGIQQLASVVSFSVTNMIEKIKSNVGDVQTFLQQMVGAAPNDVAEYGWQSSTLFTPRSGISMALGVAKSGLLGAISAVFGMIGKVVSGAANKIRSAVMTVFEDGVSYRRRSSGYNTLALQACTTHYTPEYIMSLYPSLWSKLFYESAHGGSMLKGDNTTYVATQIGSMFAFFQDWTSDDGRREVMVTVNPAIIDTDDTLAENHDYKFAQCMAQSIIHNIQFMNGLIDKLQAMGKDVSGVFKYPVPTVNDLLASIHEKAVGTSSAAAWGWRGLILGLGIAAGAILCCTGYGTAAGIALIAGVTIAAECMTAGTAVDQSKVEHLTNDRAYANATILASDLASIWTNAMPSSSIRLACYVLNLMANFYDGQNYYDLVHDGRGTAIDIDVLLGTESGSHPGEIGYLPLIEGVKRPNFRYSLVTDTQRMAISLAGAVALSIPVFILAKKAAVATANKVIAKIQAKREAEQWANEAPDKDDFTSEVDIIDEHGNKVGTKKVFDKEAYAAQKSAYTKKQAKLAYKANKLSGITINEANAESDGSIIATAFTKFSKAESEGSDTTDLVQRVIDRIG